MFNDIFNDNRENAGEIEKQLGSEFVKFGNTGVAGP